MARSMFDRVLDDTSCAVDPNPPQRRPVLVVTVHEQGCRTVGPEIPHAAQIERGFGFGVDGRVHGVTTEHETARDQVRTVFRCHRGKVSHSGSAQSLSSLDAVHNPTVST